MSTDQSKQIVIASDHAGYSLKEQMKEVISAEGYTVLDRGTSSNESVDYPDFAVRLGSDIQQGKAERGILICGSGVGASVAANKLSGIRAGLCHDTYSARQGVEHDNINVLVLGARVIGVEVASELVKTFLNASFSGAERHRRRLRKIEEIENNQQQVSDPIESDVSEQS